MLMLKKLLTGKPKIDASAEKALFCFHHHDYEGALREIDYCIKHAPDVSFSHRLKGEILFSLERYDESISNFEKSERLAGEGTQEIFFWRALAHANCGRMEKAEIILKRYIQQSDAAPEMVAKCLEAIRRFRQKSIDEIFRKFVVEIVDFVHEIDSSCTQVFYRFWLDAAGDGVELYYSIKKRAILVNPSVYADKYQEWKKKSIDIFNLHEKKSGLFLMSCQAGGCQISYEWEELQRWNFDAFEQQNNQST